MAGHQKECEQLRLPDPELEGDGRQDRHKSRWEGNVLQHPLGSQPSATSLRRGKTKQHPRTGADCREVNVKKCEDEVWKKRGITLPD